VRAQGVDMGTSRVDVTLATGRRIRSLPITVERLL
jgi:hypothetical protein